MPMHPHPHSPMSLRERAHLVEAAQRRAQMLRRQAIAALWEALARLARTLWSAPRRAMRSGQTPRPARRQPCA